MCAQQAAVAMFDPEDGHYFQWVGAIREWVCSKCGVSK